MINQVIADAIQYDIDGINLDFELISAECGEHYIQFVRELSVKVPPERPGVLGGQLCAAALQCPL